MKIHFLTASILTVLAFTPAHADFIVISDGNEKPKAAASPLNTKSSAALPRYQVLESGDNVSFKQMMSDVIPAGWRTEYDDGMMSETVSWESGRDWTATLNDIADRQNWDVKLDPKKRVATITYRDKPAKTQVAKSSAPSKTKPSVDADKQPAKDISNSKSGKSKPETVTPKAATSEMKPKAAPPATATANIKGSLSDRINVSVREKKLSEVLNILAPQGWVVDIQFDKYHLDSVVSYTNETTRSNALREVLEPIGMMYLPYPNMSPAPMIVVIKED